MLAMVAVIAYLANAGEAKDSRGVGAPAQLVFTVEPGNFTADSAMSTVKVAVQDADGNLVTNATNSITLKVDENPGGGVLYGNTTLAAVNGVATFEGLSIDKAGEGYTIAASAANLRSATSASFDVLPQLLTQATNHLEFSIAPRPTPIYGGANFEVQVVVKDPGGSLVSTATDEITVEIYTNPNFGVLTGDNVVSAVAGVADFPALSINKAGVGYTLRATAPSLHGVETGLFDVLIGAPTHLTFTVDPTNTVAGATITPAVKVGVSDAGGNVVVGSSANITLALAGSPAGATLGGTTTQGTAAGIATFGDLFIQKAGTYQLLATSGALTAATSVSFDITPAAATQLVFTQQPVNTRADMAFDVTVAVQDAFGNTVTTATDPITVAIENNAGGGTLGNNPSPVTPVAGEAVFPGLFIREAGVGYTLNANDGTLPEEVSDPFDITAAPAHHLAFTTNPPSLATATVAFPVVVEVQDEYNNVIPGATDSIAVSIENNGGVPVLGTLSGTLTQTATAGSATFGDLSVDKVGFGYTLEATSGTLVDAHSTPFDVQPGPAASLAFTTQPNATYTADDTINVEVTVLDAGGNVVPTPTIIGLTLNQTNGAILGGPNPVPAPAGVATFAVNVRKVGTGYTLTANDGPGGHTADSTAFDVTPGVPATLSWLAQPTSTTAGRVMDPRIRVGVVDAYNNVVTSAVPITIDFDTDPSSAVPPNPPVNKAGLWTENSVNGEATFNSLAVNRIANGYTLIASAGALTSPVSDPFNITLGPPAKLHFVSNAVDNVIAGQPITTLMVEIHDLGGNLVNTATNEITLAIFTNPGATELKPVGAGFTTKNAVAGVATFSNLYIEVAALGYQLQAVGFQLNGDTTLPFDVTHDVLHHLAFTTQPTNTGGGDIINSGTNVVVTAQDQFNNTVTSFTEDVSIAIGTNGGTPVAGTLAGTTPVTAVSGVATFADLSIDKAGTGYTLVADDDPSGPDAAPATSNPFDIVPGAADHLEFVAQPTNTAAGAPITPAVTVAVKDAGGNTVVSDNTTQVQLDIMNNPGLGALSGTTTQTVVGGIATFTDLSIDKVGAGYTLTGLAVNAAITGTTPDSDPFDITPGAAVGLAFTIQPVDAVSTTVIGPPVQVSVVDTNGNVVDTATDSITLAIGANPGSGTLSGTNPKSAIAGAADFDDLSIDKAGVGYTLTASASGLAGATSDAFDITAGPAAKLAFFVQPSDAKAGVNIAPLVQVEVQDAGGNRVTTATDTITVAITTGTGTPGAVLGGEPVVAAVAGVATFDVDLDDISLSIDKVGQDYTLDATAPGLAPDTSTTFDIGPGDPFSLQWVDQPTNSFGGSVIAPPMTVRVLDKFGNTVTDPVDVILSIVPGTGTVGAALSGTLTVTTVAGDAVFDNVKVDKAGTAYQLRATVVGSAPAVEADSTTFNVDPGAPHHLAFSVQPVNTVAGTAMPDVKVVVLDAGGNLIPGLAPTMVNLGIGATRPIGASLSMTAATVAGEATFSGIVFTKAGNYTIRASILGLTSATSDLFQITAGPEAKLAFVVQPTETRASTVVTPNVTVQVQDQYGNALVDYTRTITLSLHRNPGGATLTGFVRNTPHVGVAQAVFDALKVSKSANGYVLLAATAVVPGDPLSKGMTKTSQAFNVTAGDPAKIGFIAKVNNTPAMSPLTTVKVAVQDADGNTCTTAPPTDITIALGGNPAGGTLGGTKTVATVNGVADFGDLTIDKMGYPYTLSASAGALGSATSNAFRINLGTVAGLAFVQQPTNTTGGTAISPYVKVASVDAGGNIVKNVVYSITLAIANNPSGGTLSANSLTVNTSGGVATFLNVKIDKAGDGYTLVATDAGSLFAPATSAAFNVAVGAPKTLAWKTQPSNSYAGVAIAPAVEVEIRDAGGNLVTTATNAITLNLGTNPSAASLRGTRTVNAVGGVATFDNVNVSKAGNGFTLRASGSGLGLITSGTFDVSP